MRTKTEIKNLIAEGLLIEAVEAAVSYSEPIGDTETLNGLLALESDLKRQRDIWRSEQLSFEEYNRGQARVTAALLARVASLPNEPTAIAAKKRISESGYKWLVFWLFIAVKAIVFCWIFFTWQVEGFQNEEVLNAFNAILPGLMVYGSIMFREMFRSGLDADAPRRYVPGNFRVLAWVIFGAYAVVQIVLVALKAKGEISFTLMNGAMLGVEAGLGIFLKEVTDGMFK